MNMDGLQRSAGVGAQGGGGGGGATLTGSNRPTINALITGLPISLTSGHGSKAINEIVEDSRQVTRGSLFIARRGTTTNGGAFIADAVAAGAASVLTDQVISVPHSVTVLHCDDVALAAAQLAERFYGSPSQSLQLIGVTGTNGKTTIAYLVRHLLNGAAGGGRRVGMRCGLIGTVHVDDGANVMGTNLTTPPALEISRLLHLMVDHGCRACVMEASSHALHQKRTAALRFEVGAFTNLTGDHLDYHGSMDEYFNAKAILFEQLDPTGWAVVNIDDPAAERMMQRTRARVLTCSLTDRQATCLAKVGTQHLNACEVVFSAPELWGKIECRLPLLGRHNVANALQALAVAHALGVDREALQEGLETCKAPPGRLEPVTMPHDDFAVLVDYAHTDDALENVLRALRPIVSSSGKLRVVFGCGGDRDRTKRPRMANIACKYGDDIIITSDNPRTEDPLAIIDEVRSGVPHDCLGHVSAVVDRAQAIHTAIDRMDAGDILLIAGKGHEDYQIIGTTKRPFDDRLVAAQALNARKAQVSA